MAPSYTEAELRAFQERKGITKYESDGRNRSRRGTLLKIEDMSADEIKKYNGKFLLTVHFADVNRDVLVAVREDLAEGLVKGQIYDFPLVPRHTSFTADKARGNVVKKVAFRLFAKPTLAR